MTPLHPGEVLREEFMVPLGLTSQSLAAALGVGRPIIDAIEREVANINTDMADLLARYFRNTPQFWLNLQAEYDRRRHDLDHG